MFWGKIFQMKCFSMHSFDRFKKYVEFTFAIPLSKLVQRTGTQTGKWQIKEGRIYRASAAHDN